MADAYPSKPVRLIISFAPGGSDDIIGRLIATQLSERLGKQVVVDNRPGGGGIVASEIVAKSDPDGYTLLLIQISHTMQAALQKLPYDPVKSFSPIAKLGRGTYALVVHPSVPANSVKEFIALAKQKPDQLICAASGVGGDSHLVSELFKIKADINFKTVQFKGGGPATIDLVGGHSHFAMRAVPAALLYIQSGKLRVLGTSGFERSAILPDVPTIAEAGLPGYEAAIWWGISAPAGLPAPIVDRLNKELKAILTSAEVKQLLLKRGMEEVDYMGPTEFGLFIEGEINKWSSIVKKANIKLE
jgi:tripartite-type tricarboxylate transporter receptor subunit TctC